MKMRNPKVLEALENKAPNRKLTPEILSALRYTMEDWKIHRKNLKDLEISLQDFINLFNDTNAVYSLYSLAGERTISIMDSSILCVYTNPKKHDPHQVVLKLYIPGPPDVTAQVSSLCPFYTFKEELDFFQDGKQKTYQELNEKKEALAKTKKCFNQTFISICIHYVPPASVGTSSEETPKRRKKT